MARLFTCGFEECAASTDFANIGFSTVTGAPTSVTAIAHGTGLRSLKIPSPTTTFATLALAAVRTSGSLFMRNYLYIDTFGATTAAQYIFGFEGDAGSPLVSCRLTPAGANAGKLTLRNEVTGASGDMLSSTVLSLNTWYRIELKVTISKTAGSCEMKIFADNAVTPLETLTNTTNVDTIKTGTGINNVKLGNRNGADITGAGFYYLDEFALNDNTGVLQNTYPGPGVIELLTPASDVSVAWTKGGSSPAASNWQGTDDVNAGGAVDDAVTFNSDAGITNSDTMGLSSLSAGAASQAMTLMDVMCRALGVTTPCTFNLFIIDTVNGSAVSTSPAITTHTSGYTESSDAEHLVVDLTGVTSTAVNAMQVKYQGLSGLFTKRITAVWANVEYVPTANLTQVLADDINA